MIVTIQIPLDELVSGAHYVGRGRNGNVGIWDAEDECFKVLTKVGQKMGPGPRDWILVWGIKQEPYFTADSGCFQPFYRLDEGVVHKALAGEDGRRGYAETLCFEAITLPTPVTPPPAPEQAA